MRKIDAAPRRVLVVDDQLPMAEMLADSLWDRGYVASAVASAERAICRLREEPFDALVTDIRMPGVDGLELAARVRDFAPALPLVLVTAYGAMDAAREVARLGGARLFVKPFKVDDLARVLALLIDTRQAASAGSSS